MAPDDSDGSITGPGDVAATFCATLVDEWVRSGVTDAVVCPGSRSTPMALALHDAPGVRIHVHHDERSGGFSALGLGLGSARPAVVLTTSGTAAAELHPAVVEAHHASVPLLVVTSDRPPEMADVGAPQTIDQIHLYGRAARWFHAPGVPDLAARSSWRSLGSRSVAEALGRGVAGRPGPVHLDLAFREPLVGRPGDLPEGRAGGRPWHQTVASGREPDRWDLLLEVVGDAERVLVVAGEEPSRREQDGSVAARMAAACGWPLLTDARVRGDVSAPDGGAVVVGAVDAILRGPVPDDLVPDAVIHLGDPPASRVVGEWLVGTGARHVRVQGHGWTDPSRSADVVVHGTSPRALEALTADRSDRGPSPFTTRWADAEARAQRAIDAVLGAHGEPTEPGVARSVLAALAEGEILVVSSSMPIRDLEWYGRPRCGVEVVANRGANGIDGVVSTAVGVALATRRPTVCLVGDVALLHDTNGLLGLVGRGVNLTIVVVDNDGGGIFSFLPQADDPGGAVFETLFGTPHGVDLRALAAAHGLPTIEPATADEVAAAVRASLDAGGARLVKVSTDRAANVVLHQEIHAAVAAAAR